MLNVKRKDLVEVGRGTAGKTAVVGAMDHDTIREMAKVIESADKPTLQGFVSEQTESDIMVYTDEAAPTREWSIRMKRSTTQLASTF